MTKSRLVKVIIGCVLVALGSFLLISLATHDPHQGPFPDYPASTYGGNACGIVGAYVSAMALVLMGWAAYLPAAAVLLAGLAVLFRPQVPDLWIRLSGFVLFTLGVMLGLAVLNAADKALPGHYLAAPGTAGGTLGILMAGWLYLQVGSMGAWILFVLSCVLGAFLLAGPELVIAHGWAAPHVRELLGAKAAKPAQEPVPVAAEAEEAAPTAVEPEEGLVLLAEDDAAPEEEPLPEEQAEEPETVQMEEPSEAPEEAPQEVTPPEPEIIGPVVRTASDEDDVEGEEGSEFDIAEAVPQPAGGEFHIPPVRLLNEAKGEWSGEDEAELREKGRVLARTLSEFKVEAQVVSLRRGPVITMYELSLAPGTKVSKVEALADDLAIALKAPNVRIVSPLPGRNTVGIEVPNNDREVVGVRELMDETSKKHTNLAIPLFLGKDTAGKPLGTGPGPLPSSAGGWRYGLRQVRRRQRHDLQHPDDGHPGRRATAAD